MPQINKEEYTVKERKRYDAAHERLKEMINSSAPDAGAFHRALNEALAAGFPINYTLPDSAGWTLLHETMNRPAAVRAGLPQVLIAAGAGINAQQAEKGWTPLGEACWNYTQSGVPEYLTVIDLLLALGARPELDESWVDDNWPELEEQERARRMDAYIKTWHESRAKDRARDAAPGFDYAL